MTQIKQNAYQNANHSTNSHNLGANLGTSKPSKVHLIYANPLYCDLLGHHNAGLALTKLVYWTENVLKKQPEKEGWFYKSERELGLELRLTRGFVRSAIRILASLPFVSIWKGKGSRDNVTWFRVDLEGLKIALNGGIPEKNLHIIPPSSCFRVTIGWLGKPSLHAITTSINKNTTKTSGTQKDDASCVASNVENVVVDFNLISEKEKALTERFSIEAPSVEILPTIADVTPPPSKAVIEAVSPSVAVPTIKDSSEIVVESHKQPFTPFSAEIKENARSTEETRLERLKMAKNETVSEMLARLEKKYTKS